MVVGTETASHEAGIGQFVEGTALETDAERLQLGNVIGHARNDDRGIDPPREKGADRHVADQPAAHRRPDACGQLLRRLAPGSIASLVLRHQPPVAGRVQPIPVDVVGQVMRGQQFPDAGQHRLLAGDEMQGEIGVERRRVDRKLATGEARQGEELGRELQRAALVPIEQRLLAETVAGDMDEAARAIVQRKGKHAVQPLQEAFDAPGQIAVDEDLRVAARPQRVSEPQQFPAQLAIVVDFAVLHAGDAAAAADDRLLAGREIDDCEPAGGKHDAALLHIAAAVRAARVKRSAGGADHAEVCRLPACGDPSEDAAHAAPHPCSSRSSRNSAA